MNALWSAESTSSNAGAAAAASAPPPEYDYEQQGARWFTLYFRWCERNGRRIFYFWLCFLVVSAFYGPAFLTMGDDRATAPKNSPAHFAELEHQARFASQATEVPMLVLISSNHKDNLITDPRLVLFAQQLHTSVQRYNSTHENVRSILSYYTLAGTVLDSAKHGFTNDNLTSTFMSIMVSGEQITQSRYEFVRFMKDQVKALNPAPREFFIGITGLDAMVFDTSDGAAKNLMKTDSVSVPIAMALLGYMIHSWRLLLFSFMNMAVSILGGFAVMAFCVNHLGAPNPESASSQLMEVITLAISIDWCLFLHRRYRDEIKHGADARKAAYFALMHSGHVVIMSGATLWVVFFAFLALPAATVQMDGACCCMGVTIALAVALTNTPAVWLAFPDFCSDFNSQCCKDRTIDQLNEEAASMGLIHHSNEAAAAAALSGGGRATLGLNQPLLSSIPDDEEEEGGEAGDHQQATTRKPLSSPCSSTTSSVSSSSSSSAPPRTTHVMYSGPRFRFTRWVTRFPNNVFSIVLVYLLVVPFAVEVRDIVLNEDILTSLPRGSHSATTYKRAFESFPGGTFSPFYVLITSPDRADRNTVLKSGFFHAAQQCSQRVLERSQQMDAGFTAKKSVMSPVFLEGNTITLAQAKGLLKLAASHDCNQQKQPHLPNMCAVAKSYEFAWQQNVNPEQNAMLVTITVPFFPFASESAQYIDLVNELLEEMREELPNYGFYLSGTVVGFDAVQRRVVELFPRLLITTFGIVFVILGFLLRSAFVPIRLALTLVGPLCAVFGSAVLVYQKGALEWLHWVPLGRMDGFYWYIPILLLSMIIGLSLDWDVLLISRIMEHRENGYDVQAATCKAVCETGGTISVAGIIMCLAFGGMLFSDQLMINSAGFILTVALLLDTFVVNTTLVPALISIGDRVAWFPAKMPMHNLKTLTNCDEFPQD